MRGVRAWFLMLALAAMLVAAGPSSWALAVEPGEVLADPKLEVRARSLSLELRCLVCQNQSIDDSNAPLARDLRLLVRERLKAGDSDAEVMRFVVERYGDFVLLRPPFKLSTLLLWISAPLLLVVVGWLMWRGLPRAGRDEAFATADAAPLAADEEARLGRLLETPGAGDEARRR